MKKTDMLEMMWEQQREFMDLLRNKREFPEFPLDLNLKSSQVFCKQIVYEIMGELFEAVQELKNSKSHRLTEINEFDKEKLLEELVDSLHYFHELCILINITPQELYTAYLQKGECNIQRINNDY